MMNGKLIIGGNSSDPLKSFPEKMKLLATMLRAQGYKPVVFDTEGSEYENLCNSLRARRIIGPAEKIQKMLKELQESGVEVPMLNIDP